jgi:hypothetical protein
MTNLASQLRNCRTAAERAVVLQKGQAPEVAMAGGDVQSMLRNLTQMHQKATAYVQKAQQSIAVIKNLLPDIGESVDMLKYAATSQEPDEQELAAGHYSEGMDNVAEIQKLVRLLGQL